MSQFFHFLFNQYYPMSIIRSLYPIQSIVHPTGIRFLWIEQSCVFLRRPIQEGETNHLSFRTNEWLYTTNTLLYPQTLYHLRDTPLEYATVQKSLLCLDLSNATNQETVAMDIDMNEFFSRYSTEEKRWIGFRYDAISDTTLQNFMEYLHSLSIDGFVVQWNTRQWRGRQVIHGSYYIHPSVISKMKEE